MCWPSSSASLKDISLGLAYGIYAVMALLSLIFVKRWVKETTGTELEDMDDDQAGDEAEAARTE